MALYFENRNNSNSFSNGSEAAVRELRLKIKLKTVLKISEPFCTVKPGNSSQKDFEFRRL
jgi:hypothetical protein